VLRPRRRRRSVPSHLHLLQFFLHTPPFSNYLMTTPTTRLDQKVDAVACQPSFGSDPVDDTYTLSYHTLFGNLFTDSVSHRPTRRSVVLSSSALSPTSRSTVTQSARRSASAVLPARRVTSSLRMRPSWSSLSVSRGMF
jgi:hypothetical protein